MTRKTISKKANSKGTVFALVSDGVSVVFKRLPPNAGVTGAELAKRPR